MQVGQVVAVGRGVAGVGDDADDGAAQRGALQEPAAHQLHVARRVHAGPHGGAGQQDALMGEQQRQAAGDLDGAARRHGLPLRPAAPPAHGPAPPATGTREGPAGPGGTGPEGRPRGTRRRAARACRGPRLPPGPGPTPCFVLWCLVSPLPGGDGAGTALCQRSLGQQRAGQHLQWARGFGLCAC